jgi:serine O-acetyltransferase
MGRDPDWQADLRRYPPNPFVREPSIWAIWLYRLGRRNARRRRGPVRSLVDAFYRVLNRPVELLTGISIPTAVQIGPGLRIYHFGGIIIHKKTVIGANCTLRHGVTIGNRYHGGPAPVLDDGVEVGAAAQILGGVRIGRGAKIGAMTLVLQDIPPGATAVGVPARIIEPGQMAEEYRIEIPGAVGLPESDTAD